MTVIFWWLHIIKLILFFFQQVNLLLTLKAEIVSFKNPYPPLNYEY